MKKYAIVVAGCSGTRMNNEVPKQFMMLNGKPVLYYAINTFLETYEDCRIILVLPEEHVAAGQEIIDAFFGYDRIEIVIGGRTRFHSVQKGLEQIDDEESIIFVHDAVRCLVSSQLIKRCYEQTLIKGSAVPAGASPATSAPSSRRSARRSCRARTLPDGSSTCGVSSPA